MLLEHITIKPWRYNNDNTLSASFLYNYFDTVCRLYTSWNEILNKFLIKFSNSLFLANGTVQVGFGFKKYWSRLT